MKAQLVNKEFLPRYLSKKLQVDFGTRALV